VRFASDPDSDLIFRKVVEGIAVQSSVGYGISQVKITRRKDGPDIHEATRWTPHEISIVTIGADAGARVRSQQVQSTETRVGIGDNVEREPKTATAVVQDAATRERERCGYISTQCRKHGLDALERELIDNGVPLQTCKDRILDALIEAPGHEEIDSRFAPGDGKRESSFAADAAEGMLVRERMLKDTKSPGAREFVDASFSDVAERALRMQGKDTRTIRDKETLFKRAFIDSTTLANTLATFSTRSLMSGYEAVPRTFVDAFRESVSRNFRPNERTRVSDTPALAAVAEGDPFTEVSLSDRKENFTIAKYGHILKYTVEAMVNDDLGAIAREAERAGFAAAVTESNVFWSVITTNSNMSDTTPIFDAGENNLVSGVTLSADALEDAREYFRTVTTENSIKLNLAPRFLFVAPDLERTAEKLVRPPVNHSTATLTDVLSNAYASQLELRVESRLPAGDWMLAADFRQIDTLEYAWLEGRTGVRVEQEGDFDTMGLKFRVSDFFGAGAIDRRGVYYNDAA